MTEPIDPNVTGARGTDADERLAPPVVEPTPPPPPPPVVDERPLSADPERIGRPDLGDRDQERRTTADERPVVERPSVADTQFVEQRNVERPNVVERTAADQSVVEQPVIDRTVEQPIIDRTAVDQTAVVDQRDVVARSSVEQPTVVQPTVAEREMVVAEAPDRTSILRVPTFSPVAPIIGLLTAWGAVVIAVGILQRANVGLGFNIGIAKGGPGVDGFWAGVWLLVVNGGGFLLGGYAAARMARANGVRHAVLVWVVAMLATGADALVEVIGSGVTGVVRLIPGVPFWADTGLTSRGQAIGVLAIFAGVALGGAIIGGAFGQTANRIDRTDDAVVRT